MDLLLTVAGEFRTKVVYGNEQHVRSGRSCKISHGQQQTDQHKARSASKGLVLTRRDEGVSLILICGTTVATLARAWIDHKTSRGFAIPLHRLATVATDLLARWPIIGHSKCFMHGVEDLSKPDWLG